MEIPLDVHLWREKPENFQSVKRLVLAKFKAAGAINSHVIVGCKASLNFCHKQINASIEILSSFFTFLELVLKPLETDRDA